MRTRNPYGLGSLILGLALAACQPGENTANPPGAETYDTPVPAPSMIREIQALKKREQDPARLDAAIREVLLRHGYAVPAPESPAVVEQRPPDGAELAVDALKALPAAAVPLGKSTAPTKVWLSAKSFDFTFPLAFQRSYSVSPGKAITVEAEALQLSDPILVAYSRTSGTSASSAFTIEILGYNDDRDSGNFDAYIRWVNNTSSTREVAVMAFAQTASTTGKTNITITGVGTMPDIFLNEPISARPVFNNISTQPIGGCTGPSASRIQLGQGGGYGRGIIAVNAATLRGGVIVENGTSQQTLALQDVLRAEGISFLMGFVLRVPSVRATPITGIQQNQYTCIFP